MKKQRRVNPPEAGPDEIAPDEIVAASHRVNWHLTGQVKFEKKKR
ncbi:MAG: hypothetical protein WCE45_11385 [Sedimentisphaerales bacterium]